MPITPFIYLAGPTVFLPNSMEEGARLKVICSVSGGVGLYPLDNVMAGVDDLAGAIRKANMKLIGRCDAVVADMSPFRGPGMDGGTAYEMGAAAALGKPVFAYTRNPASYRERVLEFSQCAIAQDGRIRDSNKMEVESFEEPLIDNLMMAKGVVEVFDNAEEAIGAAIAYVLTAKKAVA